jgi:3D (Asp-Asp-Asp) domain-containing protein
MKYALGYAAWLLCGCVAGGAPRHAAVSVPAANGAYMWVIATAYCPCRKCTPGHGHTCTGRNAWRPGVAVAQEAGRQAVPLGARLDIPIYGERRGWWTLVDDTGSGVGAGEIDVRFASHEEAVQWGRKRLLVRVWLK